MREESGQMSIKFSKEPRLRQGTMDSTAVLPLAIPNAQIPAPPWKKVHLHFLDAIFRLLQDRNRSHVLRKVF
jgi:hypothetical protein